MQLILATHNAHKLAEFRRMIGGHIDGYDGPEPVENGVTFAENALIKARAAAEHTRLPALADDSGLIVEIMGQAPGILSARWSGPERSDAANRDLVLWQLHDIPDGHRQAAFHASLALVVPGEGAPGEHVVTGVWEGTVAHAASGDQGFGYDPIFIPNGQQETVADLSAEYKDAHSHRSLAISKMLPILRRLGLAD